MIRCRRRMSTKSSYLMHLAGILMLSSLGTFYNMFMLTAHFHFEIDNNNYHNVILADHTSGSTSRNSTTNSTQNTSLALRLDKTYTHAFPNQTILYHNPKVISYDEIVHLTNLDISLPQNLNILMAGDSLTRYQYLDLAYFLAHNGTWVQPNDTPNMVMEQTIDGGWPQFYNFTNTMLKPYEQCDCYRVGRMLSRNLDTVVENRYFYEEKNNNRLTYLQKFGDFAFRSNWNVSDIYKDHDMIQSANEINFVYQGGWMEYIQDFVCKMEPKPTAFIFNQGLWDQKDLKNETVQNHIVQTLKECNIFSVYKTTTNRDVADYEYQLCNKTDFCYDISWTKRVPPTLRWDELHFRPPIYSMLNVQLITSILSKMNNHDNYTRNV